MKGAGMNSLLQEVRLAVRSLVKRPGFALVAILTLALGIGASTAIFSVLDAVLLRPLPYPNQERIVELRELDEKAMECRLRSRTSMTCGRAAGVSMRWRNTARGLELFPAATNQSGQMFARSRAISFVFWE